MVTSGATLQRGVFHDVLDGGLPKKMTVDNT